MGILIHRVVNGDSLNSIGKKYKVPPYIIAKENNINNIEAGMRLIIPSVKGDRYVVKPYEDLTSIAEKFNVSLRQLKENNLNIKNVFLGQVIYIPYSGNS